MISEEKIQRRMERVDIPTTIHLPYPFSNFLFKFSTIFSTPQKPKKRTRQKKIMTEDKRKADERGKRENADPKETRLY